MSAGTCPLLALVTITVLLCCLTGSALGLGPLSHSPHLRLASSLSQQGRQAAGAALSMVARAVHTLDGKKSQQVGGRGSRRESHLPKLYCLVAYFCHQALPPNGTAALTTLQDGSRCQSMAGHGSEQNSWSCQLAMATTFQEAHCVTGRGTPMLTNTVRGV